MSNEKQAGSRQRLRQALLASLATWWPEAILDSPRNKSPLRDDSHTGSYYIYPDGSCCDFARDNERSDLIDCYQAIKGLDERQQMDVFGILPSSTQQRNTQRVDRTEEKTVWNVASTPLPMQFLNQKKHNLIPTYIHIYRDSNGFEIGYLLRWEYKDNDEIPKKDITIYTYSNGWQNNQKGWQGKLPLYGLEKLSKEGRILVVEGEKCADVAQKLLGDDWIVVAIAGASKVKKTDTSLLVGRNVYLWPDNDDPGFECMDFLLCTVKGTKIISKELLKDKPKKWDIADAILTDKLSKKEILEIILSASEQIIDGSEIPIYHQLPANRLNLLMTEIDCRSSIIEPVAVKATAINMLAQLFFSQYRTPMFPDDKHKSRLCNYTIFVGEGGDGKNAFTGFSDELRLDQQFEVQELKSKQALLDQLDGWNAKIMKMNEIGKFLPTDQKDTFKEDVIVALNSAWSGESISGTATKDRENAKKKVEYPLFCILGAMTIKQFQRVMKNSDFNEGGFYFRTNFIVMSDVPQHKKEFDMQKSTEISTSLRKIIEKKKEELNEYINSTTLPTDLSQATFYRFFPRIKSNLEGTANEIQKEMYRKICDMQRIEREKGNTILAGVLRRSFEKIMQTATILSLWEQDTEEVDIRPEYLKWAWDFQMEVIKTNIRYMGIANEETIFARLKASIIEAMKTFQKGEKVLYSKMKEKNIGEIRGARSKDIKEAVSDLEETGHLLVENSGKSMYLTLLKW